jgi:hypothetical protein
MLRQPSLPLRRTVYLFVSIAQPTNRPITGTAKVPAGGALSVQFVGAQPQKLTTGAFSIPYQGS